jgi:hypothetical protein
MFDLTDPTRPRFMWRHNPHETHGWPGCYHSFVVPDGSEFGIATQESTTVNCDHPPAHITFYDLRNVDVPLPISTFQPYRIDPTTMRPVDRKWCRTGARYGAHNIWLDMTKDDLIYICWFAAGLRVVDWSDPFAPKEAGYYIPAGTRERCCPQSNDHRPHLHGRPLGPRPPHHGVYGVGYLNGDWAFPHSVAPHQVGVGTTAPANERELEPAARAKTACQGRVRGSANRL